jgi:putative nucleotidyltransferase with HDIG domain
MDRYSHLHDPLPDSALHVYGSRDRVVQGSSHNKMNRPELSSDADSTKLRALVDEWHQALFPWHQSPLPQVESREILTGVAHQIVSFLNSESVSEDVVWELGTRIAHLGPRTAERWVRTQELLSRYLPELVPASQPSGGRQGRLVILLAQLATGFFSAAEPLQLGSGASERSQHEREQDATIRMAAALRNAASRAEMLPIIVEYVAGYLGARASALLLRGATDHELVVEKAVGDWATLEGMHIRLSGTARSTLEMLGKSPYSLTVVEDDPVLGCVEQSRTLSYAACVPLIAQGENDGVLYVGSNRAFSDDEGRVLAAIGDITAAALHRATLHEQTRRRLLRLSALRSIDMALTSSYNLQVTLNILLDQVTAHLDVDAAAVLLYEPENQTLECVAVRGFQRQNITRARWHILQSPGGRAVRSRLLTQIPSLEAAGSLGGGQLSHLRYEGFTTYYGMPLITKGEVKGVLELFHRTPMKADNDPEWVDFLETLAGQAAIAIDSAELFDRLQRSNAELALAYDATLEGWSRALDLRDKETEGHSFRVTQMALNLARRLGMNDEQLTHIRRGALLHDIGKMGIPDRILLKPGPLTSAEWEIMRCHPTYAYELLSPIGFLRPALHIPYCHHEKWDGTGYPRHLEGDQIPLEARIFAVVDVWDAMCSDRPYRPGWPKERVREYIFQQAGSHFDPTVVDAFLRNAHAA